MDEDIDMSTSITVPSRPNDEACVPHVQQGISQTTVASSTPNWGHEYSPFDMASDISSVSSRSSTPEKRLKTAHKSNNRRTASTSKKTNVERNSLLNKVQQLSLISSVSNSNTSFASSKAAASLKFSSSEDEDDTPRKSNIKRVNKGRDWALYKPKFDDRIYTFIVESPDTTIVEAKKWINNYENVSASDAIIALLQFMVDICGFPNFNLSNKFNYKEPNFMEVMKFMEQHPPQIQQKGFYLMRGTSEWCKQTHRRIFDFMKNILKLAHERGMLYDLILIRYLVEFPVVLSRSANRSMFQTGITFVMKIYTILLYIHKQTENQKPQGTHLTQDLLYELIKNMQTVIVKACTINDSSISGVRVIFCEEVIKWFKKDPTCIRDTKFLRRLLALVCDQSRRVRIAALNTCHKLVQTVKFGDYLDNMNEFVTTISGRLNDVDFTVAITAIKIHTTMLKTYPNEILQTSCSEIVKLMYYDHYSLSQAAGKFVIEMIETVNDPDDSLPERIHQVVNIYQATQTENCAPVFVEALVHNCPELQQWHEVITILLNDTLQDHEELALIDIFCQAASQILSGKSKFQRKKAPHGHVKSSSTKNATNAILLNLHSLLIKFSNEPVCVLQLTELLLSVDFSYMSPAKHTDAMMQTVNILIKKYAATDNVILLESISKIFVRFLDESCTVKPRVEGSIMTAIEAVCAFFLKILEELSQVDELSKEDASKLESSLLRLSVLFVDHDLTEMISYENFSENWSEFEDTLPPKCMKHLVRITCWHLIWQFKVIIENGSKAEPANELQQEIAKVKFQCNDYIQKCLQLIESPQHVQLSEMAFQCICDILLKFNDIDNSIRHNQALKELIPTFNNVSQKTFMTFVHNMLFTGTFKSPLQKRRQTLGSVINIIFTGAINVLELPKIYVHYNSHYTDYGDILTKALQKLRDNNVQNVNGVILMALRLNYTKMIVNNVAVFTLENTYCIALSKLAAQFQAFIKKNTSQLTSLLQMGINYSALNESTYAFLHFLKCFAAQLSMEDKKLILNYLNENFPEANKKHEAFLSFTAHLKKKSAEKPLAKDQSKSSSLSTTTITSIDISGSDDINDFDTDYAISEFSE